MHHDDEVLGGDGGHSESSATNKDRKGRHCPYDNCPRRTQPFAKRKELRIHYRGHVECDEVCVYCYRVFKTASSYLKHDIHRKETDKHGTKVTYMTQRRQLLVNRVDQELEIAEKRGKKRTSTSAWEFDEETPKRIKLGQENPMAARCTKGTSAGVLSPQSIQPAKPNQSRAFDEATQLSGVNFGSNLNHVLHDSNFHAPVNTIINSIQYDWGLLDFAVGQPASDPDNYASRGFETIS